MILINSCNVNESDLVTLKYLELVQRIKTNDINILAIHLSLEDDHISSTKSQDRNTAKFVFLPNVNLKIPDILRYFYDLVANNTNELQLILYLNKSQCN